MISFFPSRAVAMSIGPLAVHWYGVMYALAFFIGFWWLPRLVKYRKLALQDKDIEQLALWVIIGVLIGGRAGFVLFYGLPYFLDHPLEILAVWQGGMSSHGGFIGVTVALILFAQSRQVSLLAIADIIVAPVAVGLALGRVGNFINGELYGTITTVPWAMHFTGVEGLRHPTQLYAVMKDLLIALICLVHLRRTSERFSSGEIAAIFLILYGILRFIVEIFRDQPYGFVSVAGLELSWGQIYTIPVFLCGFVVFWLSRKKFPMHNAQ